VPSRPAGTSPNGSVLPPRTEAVFFGAVLRTLEGVEPLAAGRYQRQAREACSHYL
jgi:hypothetical protein